MIIVMPQYSWKVIVFKSTMSHITFGLHSTPGDRYMLSSMIYVKESSEITLPKVI